MRISLFVLLISLVWVGRLPAQTFNKAELYNSSSYYFENVLQLGTKYYYTGFGSDTTKLGLPQLTLLKTDINGKLILFEFFGDTLNGKFYTARNGLIGTEQGITITGKYSNDTIFNTPFVLDMDTNFNLLSFKILDLGIYNANDNHGILKLANGSSIIYSAGYFSSNDNADVSIHYFDVDYNQMWSRHYGSSTKWEQPYSAQELPNGNIIIGAQRTDNSSQMGVRYKEQTWIFEIDTAGNKIREFLDPDTKTGPAKGITQTADGGFVYCGKKQTYWNGNSTYYYGGTVSKLDSTLTNKQWELMITDTLGNISSMEQIIKVDSNNFIAIGNDASEPIDKSWLWTRAGLITKINGNGQVKWKRYYFGKEEMERYDRNYLYDVVIDNQNNIIAAGKVEQDGGPNLGWVLKLDSNGCLNENFCGYPALSVKENLKSNEEELQFYPNPTSDILNIKANSNISEIKLYNLLGEKVFSQTNPKAQINLKHLPNGIYLLKLETDKGISTQKIVKN